MPSWVQPYDDPLGRVTIAHTGSPRRTWTVDGAFTHFEGRVYPVGARGEHVASEVEVATVWEDRAAAEAFATMLRDAALSVDGRVEVHLGAMDNGQPLEFVAEVHAVPEDLTLGKTTVAVTFRQVDGMFTE